MSKTDGLFWECAGCGVTQPRHADTRAHHLGQCPKCGGAAWLARRRPRLANIGEVLVYAGTTRDTATRPPRTEPLMGDARVIALRMFKHNRHHGSRLTYWRQLPGGGIERILDPSVVNWETSGV